MTPILRAQQWYEQYIPNDSFGADLADFMVGPGNVVIVRPDVFLMAHQLRWDNEAKQVVEGEPNAWYVRMGAVASGMAPHEAFTKATPWHHEWVLWQRRDDGKIRARRWNDLATKGR